MMARGRCAERYDAFVGEEGATAGVVLAEMAHGIAPICILSTAHHRISRARREIFVEIPASIMR